MKQPRTDDFDPNAKKPSLKSSMDNFPTIEKPSPQPLTDNSSKDVLTLVRPVLPVRVEVPVSGQKRKIKSRHPFDIYEDQAETLKQLSLEERMRGGVGSMSAMVREALDNYIAQKKSE